MLDSLFRTHRYLLEHTDAPVRRALMDEINWHDRLIGIKGSRGVGKTTFLLQYAKEHFNPDDRRCLYINMNSFYFQGHSLVEFAGQFYRSGGQVLLIDQVFKQPDWSKSLHECYNTCPMLKIVFTGSSVMRLKDENPELNGICKSYNLRGFSFREYLNMATGLKVRPYTLREIENRHERIAKEVTDKVDDVMKHFQAYLHHGYYPFFLEKTNFSENLLKVMNMMIEVDVLLLKQIELKYLDKIKRLFYLLATGDKEAPNVSQLAADIQTSRATVMNYIKYLSDARLLNTVYRKDEMFPKKPARIMMHNTNLMYAVTPGKVKQEEMMETFFQNSLWGRHDVKTGDRSCTFLVDNHMRFRILEGNVRRKATDVIYVRTDITSGSGLEIPIWLYGLLY